MVAERITLVRAPNPSAMTLSGTNSYLIDGENGQAICIDPGPEIPRHIDALVSAAYARAVTIALICITHGHPDHAPGARLLARRTGAPVAAHRASPFPHDRSLEDGDILELGKARLRAVDAPGHTFDHLVYYEERDGALFTGDVVLGEGYVVIAPPGGAMRAYEQTLARLLREFPHASRIYGGHGAPVDAPQEKLRDYIDHRRTRERELLARLNDGPQTIPQLVAAIYPQTSRTLWPAAARQMLAYLIALEQEGRVRSRTLDRPMSAQEHAILNPEWEHIVGEEHAQTVREELGAMVRLDELRAYEVAP